MSETFKEFKPGNSKSKNLIFKKGPVIWMDIFPHKQEKVRVCRKLSVSLILREANGCGMPPTHRCLSTTHDEVNAAEGMEKESSNQCRHYEKHGVVVRVWIRVAILENSTEASPSIKQLLSHNPASLFLDMFLKRDGNCMSKRNLYCLVTLFLRVKARID